MHCRRQELEHLCERASAASVRDREECERAANVGCWGGGQGVRMMEGYALYSSKHWVRVMGLDMHSKAFWIGKGLNMPGTWTDM